MGWNPFKDSWSKEYKKAEDSVKGAFKDIDNDLNISENKDALVGLATFGQLGYLAGSAYSKAKEQKGRQELPRRHDLLLTGLLTLEA